MIMKRYFWSLIQKITELFGRFQSGGAYVLMFHNVCGDNEIPGDKSISVTASAFESFINALIAGGVRFAPVSRLSDAASSGAVVITFDDMFLSAYENAVPLLEEKKIPYCVFISDRFIGADGYVSPEQIHKLSQSALCTVGFHSSGHKMLRGLSDDEAKNELVRTRLSGITGKSAEYFAFPYGSLYACGEKKARLAKGLYKYSFSTVSARCSAKLLKKRPYYLPRINVCGDNCSSIQKRLIKQSR